MNGVGIWGVIAGLLQLTIPPYAFRLVRLFGAQRVGWFLFSVFTSLAVMHTLERFKPVAGAGGFAVSLDIMYAIGSVLLLIGMGHMESLFKERLRAADKEKSLRQELDRAANEKAAELVQSNKELTQEAARRAENERVLRASETQYRYLFVENPQPMWIFDLRTFQFLAVNKAALSQYGYLEQEFMALTAGDLFPSEEAVAAFTADSAKPCLGSAVRGHWRHCKKDGSEVDVEIIARDLKHRGYPARLILARDIGQQLWHEQEMLHGQKMETIGRVAAGVAHHFNDTFAVIQGNTELLQKSQGGAGEELDQILAAVRRGNSITRQLAAVGREQTFNPEPLDLSFLIQQLNKTLRRLLGESTEIEYAAGANVPAVLADAHAVENLIVNLVLNGRDAVSNRGKLTLSTAAVRISSQEALRHYEAREGEFVCLKLRDTGCGMTPEVQAQLFEPFFTTKEGGKALGLGLASVYGIVRQHSGWVECRSQQGQGTEFRVFFPCAPQSVTATVRSAQAAKVLEKQTILLIEPNDQMRAVARFILDRAGYCVVEADSASLALTLWESRAAKIDLVITETCLPDGASGWSLAEELRQTKPELKIVYSHAGDAPNEAQDADEFQLRPLIPKPYTAEKLLQTIGECMVEVNASHLHGPRQQGF